MSGTPNYLKAGDINRSMTSREIVDYLPDSSPNWDLYPGHQHERWMTNQLIMNGKDSIGPLYPIFVNGNKAKPSKCFTTPLGLLFAGSAG